jgi:putative Ca2+/H+ antiporter (TMEM165/GDT1 family)
MLEHQFYWRLIFIVIFGTILVSTMISFAKHNSVEELPKKRIVLKVLGVLFLILAMLCGVSSIVNLVDLTHPTEMVGPYIHRNMIVRHTSVPLIWGVYNYGARECYFCNSLLFHVSIFSSIFILF